MTLDLTTLAHALILSASAIIVAMIQRNAQRSKRNERKLDALHRQVNGEEEE